MAIPELATATHVVGDSNVAGRLLSGGAKAFIVVSDCLLYGPCDADPVAHSRARRAFWNFDESAEVERDPDYEPLGHEVRDHEEFASAIASLDGPLVLWTTPCWKDSLQLWWVLDCIERLGPPTSEIWIVDGGSSRGEVPGQRGLELFGYPELLASYGSATQLGGLALEQGAKLWRAYAATSPTEFDLTRRGGVKPFRDLAITALRHGDWFPVLTDRLRLSTMDELILSGFSTEKELAPLQILRVPAVGRRIEDHLFRQFGDLILYSRIAAFGTHGPDAPLEVVRSSADPENWSQWRCRLTASGKRLLDEGMRTVEDAPPIYIGGCLIHSKAHPWVRLIEGDSWRIIENS